MDGVIREDPHIAILIDTQSTKKTSEEGRLTIALLSKLERSQSSLILPPKVLLPKNSSVHEFSGTALCYFAISLLVSAM